MPGPLRDMNASFHVLAKQPLLFQDPWRSPWPLPGTLQVMGAWYQELAMPATHLYPAPW